MMDVAAAFDVSRETAARLQLYAELLTKWNARINLVAPATLADLWVRHIQDSTQVFALAPATAGHWVDLGTGGGLPGLICAILAAEKMPDCRFTLIESDQRKAAFLMTAARELGLTAVTVLAQRIEAVPPQSADIVSARALAPLPALLPMVIRHCAARSVALLPKGRDWASEVKAAQAEWNFTLTAHSSQTDSAARVLEIKELTRV
jgi:16S rRNA (guanine527-N7)-methyltransferase